MTRTNDTAGTRADAATLKPIGGQSTPAMTGNQVTSNHMTGNHMNHWTTCHVTVGGEACAVRVTSLLSIPEVLGFEDEMQLMSAGVDGDVPAADDAQAIADLLESRMIAPPRPRRRRERAVSSRAVFFHAAAR